MKYAGFTYHSLYTQHVSWDDPQPDAAIHYLLTISPHQPATSDKYESHGHDLKV